MSLSKLYTYTLTRIPALQKVTLVPSQTLKIVITHPPKVSHHDKGRRSKR
jgi:hypothetical protein